MDNYIQTTEVDDIKDLTAIRCYEKSDTAFIINAWLHGFKNGCEYFKLIDHSAYMDVYGTVLNKIITKDNVDIKIICLADTPEIILGFSVFELTTAGIILHWVYVKPDWRNNGVGLRLLPENIKYCTHLTKIGKSLLKKHPEIKFNPFLI